MTTRVISSMHFTFSLTHSPNYTSGQQFSEGTYTILFMAKNDDGDISTCVLGFSVKGVYPCLFEGHSVSHIDVMHFFFKSKTYSY